MNPLWLLKGSDLNQASAREANQYVGKFMLAENAVTQYGDFISIERDEIAVQSKNYSFEDWKTFLKYQINILMASYFGYGKELLYYANNINIKPVTLFDHLISTYWIVSFLFHPSYLIFYGHLQLYIVAHKVNL